MNKCLPATQDPVAALKEKVTLPLYNPGNRSGGFDDLQTELHSCVQKHFSDMNQSPSFINV